MPPKKKPTNKVGKKKTANGYEMPHALPTGLILQDVSKKQWILGPSIGTGGFGEIYSAKEVNSTSNEYPYVIKIEPHKNGPLFVEMHFYMRCGKPNLVKEFQQKKGLRSFGMPVYFGTGSHEHGEEKYRFLVMQKFGSDIWKLFLENNRIFPVPTVFQIALQILNVLEYIHECGYVHWDIKGANILMDLNSSDKQVYLVDFGLATKFTIEKEYKRDPRKMHDGTIEYLSRDAHNGVPTRRGDLEILFYNMIQWLGGTLPWINITGKPENVQASKEENMKSATMLKKCFGDKPFPEALTKFLKYLETLKFNTEPDYDYLHKILEDGLKEAGGKLENPLQFSSSTSQKSSGSKRKSMVSLPVAVKKKARISIGQPSSVKARKKKTLVKRNKAHAIIVSDVQETNNLNDSTVGFTAAMKEVYSKKKNAKSTKNKKTVKIDNTDTMTEEMKEISKKITKNNVQDKVTRSGRRTKNVDYRE